jgi:hypothetical protein
MKYQITPPHTAEGKIHQPINLGRPGISEPDLTFSAIDAVDLNGFLVIDDVPASVAKHTFGAGGFQLFQWASRYLKD